MNHGLQCLQDRCCARFFAVTRSLVHFLQKKKERKENEFQSTGKTRAQRPQKKASFCHLLTIFRITPLSRMAAYLRLFGPGADGSASSMPNILVVAWIGSAAINTLLPSAPIFLPHASAAAGSLTATHIICEIPSLRKSSYAFK